MRAARTTQAILLAVTVGVVGGCTARAAHPPTATDTPTATSSQTGTASGSATASSSDSTSVFSSTSASTSSSASVSTPGTGPALPTCQTSQLSLSAVRGASASQQAFATLVLTNHGGTCVTAGFPGVSLLLNGRQIGPAASRVHTTYRSIQLTSGASAHAVFTISTACDAGRSDHVRVYPPDQLTALESPLSVFACSSTIGPMQPAKS